MPNPERYRCPQCRTRRTDGRAMVLHMMQCPRPVCDCGGYPFKHRTGSGYCHANPDSVMRHAVHRTDMPRDALLDMAADHAFHTKGKLAKVCPF